jgi:hypothetical protein
MRGLVQNVRVHAWGQQTCHAVNEGNTQWLVDFLRPTYSLDGGDGYTVTVRAFNATCNGDCTAREGVNWPSAIRVRNAQDFDWFTTATLMWNGEPSLHSVSVCHIFFESMLSRGVRRGPESSFNIQVEAV